MNELEKKSEEATLDTPMDELEQMILAETDSTKLQRLIDIFNINIKKKDVLRTGKLSELQDVISQQMVDRVVTRGDELSPRDLLDYHRTIQGDLDKSIDKQAEIKTIQLTQNQINVNMENTLSRDSRQKIAVAVEAFLKKIGATQEEGTTIIQEDEKND